MSVDPYMRGRMNDVKSYTAAVELGEPIDGGAIGEVVTSNADGFAEGDLVLHQLGWREVAVSRRRRARRSSTSRACRSPPISACSGCRA